MPSGLHYNVRALLPCTSSSRLSCVLCRNITRMWARRQRRYLQCPRQYLVAAAHDQARDITWNQTLHCILPARHVAQHRRSPSDRVTTARRRCGDAILRKGNDYCRGKEKCLVICLSYSGSHSPRASGLAHSKAHPEATITSYHHPQCPTLKPSQYSMKPSSLCAKPGFPDESSCNAKVLQMPWYIVEKK